MRYWRKLLLNYKSICWAILVAIIMLSLLPAHIHIHHEEAAFSDTHVMSSHAEHHTSSIHAMTNIAGHDNHEEVTSIPVTPDTLVKKVNANLSLVAILISVFVFLSIVVLPLKPQSFRNLHCRSCYIGISPPLRAPPLL